MNAFTTKDRTRILPYGSLDRLREFRHSQGSEPASRWACHVFLRARCLQGRPMQMRRSVCQISSGSRRQRTIDCPRMWRLTMRKEGGEVGETKNVEECQTDRIFISMMLSVRYTSTLLLDSRFPSIRSFPFSRSSEPRSAAEFIKSMG